jgi:hypothetical protein
MSPSAPGDASPFVLGSIRLMALYAAGVIGIAIMDVNVPMAVLFRSGGLCAGRANRPPPQQSRHGPLLQTTYLEWAGFASHEDIPEVYMAQGWPGRGPEVRWNKLRLV